MKFLSLIAGFCALLFLSACGGEDLDQFAGRWSLQGDGLILQINKVEENSLQVDRMYVTALHEIARDTAFATVKDGIMTVNFGGYGESYRYDKDKRRLIGRDGSYRKVPPGWMWRDGYDGIPD